MKRLHRLEILTTCKRESICYSKYLKRSLRQKLSNDAKKNRYRIFQCFSSANIEAPVSVSMCLFCVKCNSFENQFLSVAIFIAFSTLSTSGSFSNINKCKTFSFSENKLISCLEIDANLVFSKVANQW